MPAIPYVIEKSGREERVYDVYSRLLKDRIIFLGSQVNDEVANALVATGGAGRITVQLLELGPADIAFTVEDDGAGMPPVTPDTATHYGLAVMRERATRLGGTLEVTARPGGGTQVVLVFALQPRRTLAAPPVVGAGVH